MSVLCLYHKARHYHITAWASALLVLIRWAMREPLKVGRVTGTDSHAFSFLGHKSLSRNFFFAGESQGIFYVMCRCDKCVIYNVLLNMRLFRRSSVIVLLLCVCYISVSAQQVTREQLLKLFYQASVAQKKGDTDKAIDIYKELLTKAPGLPDPYLQLGDIFYSMKYDANLQRKAQISYSQYLKLKPDADNASIIQQRIDEIEKDFKSKENLLVTEAIVPKAESEETGLDNAITEEEEVGAVKLAETVDKPKFSVVLSETLTTEAEEDTLTVDSLRVVPEVRSVQADGKLLGRWVSRNIDSNGHEQWILDLYSQEGNLWMRLNDHSAVLKNLGINSNGSLETEAKLADEDMSFRFVAKNQDAGVERTPKTGTSSVVAELFDVDFDGFKSSFYSPDETENKEASNETEQFEFLLHTLGERLIGTVVQQTFVDGMKKGEKNEDEIILLKVPENYDGLSYTAIPDESKTSNLELRRLLNRKSTEASSSASALNDLACMIASGLGTKKNMRMAVAHFMEAVGKNNLFAMLNLAKLYQEGNGVEKDMRKAQELYQRAYDSGYTDAMVLCGDAILEQYDDSTDPKEAIRCYEKAVLKRSPYASYRLGWAYKEGIGVDVDESRALSYYQRAVDMQYPDAMAEMGIMYREGILVSEDVAKAKDLLQKAAAKNSTKAMKELADMYLDGNTVEFDFQKSKEWLSKYILAEEDLINGYCAVKNEIKNILRPTQK